MRARNQKRCSSLSMRTAPPDHRQTRGVTLLELVTCLAISAVLVGGLASSVYLSTKGLETLTSATNVALDSSAALNQLTADVRLATGFTERTATAMTFTVPDRTGDGWPDTIRYAWAGAGSPLTRTVNGLPNPAATILENVSALELTYLTRTMQPPIVESAEQLLCSFTVSSATGDGISSTNWDAQYFKPSLPANAIAWKITKIRLTMKQNVASKTFNIAVTNVDSAQKPTGAALETYSASTSTLSTSPTTYDFAFSNLSGLDPSVGKAFQVNTSATGSAPLNLRIQTTVSPATSGMSFCRSTTAGVSWTTPVGTTAVDYQVYGTITTQGP